MLPKKVETLFKVRPGEGPTTMKEKGIHDGAHQGDHDALQNFGQNGRLGADAILLHGKHLEFAVTCGMGYEMLRVQDRFLEVIQKLQWNCPDPNGKVGKVKMKATTLVFSSVCLFCDVLCILPILSAWEELLHIILLVGRGSHRVSLGQAGPNTKKSPGRTPIKEHMRSRERQHPTLRQLQR